MSFRIERSARIQAPPGKIFPLVNDFHRWRDWSPWEGIDPQLRRDYSGAAAGKGAAYAWQGNRKVGSGRMEIVECVPPARIVLALDFLTPFKARNTAEFTFTPRQGATVVTWAMTGQKTLLSTIMGFFINMDRMVGGQFEQGLANLKSIAEK